MQQAPGQPERNNFTDNSYASSQNSGNGGMLNNFFQQNQAQKNGRQNMGMQGQLFSKFNVQPQSLFDNSAMELEKENIRVKIPSPNLLANNIFNA
jgi:hypothetical protein